MTIEPHREAMPRILNESWKTAEWAFMTVELRSKRKILRKRS